MKTPRKLTALVLMGAMTASSVAAVPASAKTFSDVSAGHWAREVVDIVSNRGIMVGMAADAFSPNTQLTRAQYTAILCNLAPDKSNGSYEAHLTDVNAGAWYAEVAEWGVTNGIIAEINGRFDGDSVLSRELMASMTLQYLNLYYKDSIKQDNSSAGYADESSINPKYLNAVNLLSNNGLLAGRSDNKFEPSGTLTRAEAAAMAARLMDIADKAGTTTPEDPDEEQPPAENPELPPVDSENPDEEKPPVEEPSNPDEEQPPAEDPAEDPNDPANWDLDGAPDWFLVGKPDSISQEVWDQLIDYYAGKERPANSNYPSSIKDLPSEYQHNEKLAKEFCGARMEELISIMQKDLSEQATIQALTEDFDVEITAEEQEMIRLVNNARKEAGMSELIISPALCKAADIRADETNTVYGHTRPNGDGYKTVLNDIGLANISNSINMGENLMGYYSGSDDSAENAFKALWDSEKHRENMLNPKYQYIGVGYQDSGSDTSWIQTFAYIR